MFAEQIVCLNVDFVSTNRYKLGYRLFFSHFKRKTVQRSRGMYKINASMSIKQTQIFVQPPQHPIFYLQSRLDLLLHPHSLDEGQYTEVLFIYKAGN